MRATGVGILILTLICCVTAVCGAEFVPQIPQATPVVESSFSRTGRIATSNGRGLVDIWDVRAEVLLRTLIIPMIDDEMQSPTIALSPDGLTLAYTDAKSGLQLWSVATGRLTGTLWHTAGSPRKLVWCPDGSAIAVDGREVQLWDIKAGKPRRSFPSSEDIAFSADGKLLAAVCDGHAKLFDVATGKLIRTFSDASGVMPPIAISPDRTLIATGGEDPNWKPDIVAALESETIHALKVKLWNAKTGKLIRMLPGHSNRDGDAHLHFLSDSRTLFSSGGSYTALWDTRTGKRKRSFSEPSSISPDGKLIATASDRSNSLTISDAHSGKTLFSSLSSPGRIRALAFSSDGKYLAAGGEDSTSGSLQLWDMKSGAMRWDRRHEVSGINDIGFLPGGRVMSNGFFGSRIWTVEKGDLLSSAKGPTENPDSGPEQKHALLSPDGSVMVSESGEALHQSLQVRDAASSNILRIVPIEYGTIVGSAFSPDGRYLAANVGLALRRVEVFDLTTGKSASTLQDAQYARPLVFSRGSKMIAGSLDWGVALWDRDSGRRLPVSLRMTDGCRPEKREIDRPRSLAFAPDGKTLAAGSVGRVRLYDTVSGKEIASLQAGGAALASVEFSPDGARVAAGNDAGRIYVWDASTHKLLITLAAFPPLSTDVLLPCGWCAWTPEGYCDWSTAMERHIRWNDNGRILPALVLAPTMRRHNLLKPAASQK